MYVFEKVAANSIARHCLCLQFYSIFILAGVEPIKNVEDISPLQWCKALECGIEGIKRFVDMKFLMIYLSCINSTFSLFQIWPS